MKAYTQAQSHPKCLSLDAIKLQDWLEPLSDIAQVECDGMTRLVSHLLSKNGIEHVVAGGHLVDIKRIDDPSVSNEELCGVSHWWVELGYSYIIDFRARMWLGSEAQHGVFVPCSRFEYRTERRWMFPSLPEPVLDSMAGVKISDWPSFIEHNERANAADNTVDQVILQSL